MAIRNLTTTQFSDGEILFAADLNDTIDSALIFGYAGGNLTVLEGLELTGTGAQTVDLATGFYVGSDGKSRTKAAEAGISLTAASGANPRYDLISLQNDGTVTVTDGTAAADPSVPATPANETVIGAVFRATSDNTTTDGDIAQLGVLWSPSVDKIYERTGVNITTGTTIAVPLTNGPNTYTKFKIVVDISESSTGGCNLDLRVNKLNGASDYTDWNNETFLSSNTITHQRDITTDSITVFGPQTAASDSNAASVDINMSILKAPSSTNRVAHFNFTSSETFEDLANDRSHTTAGGYLNNGSSVSSVTSIDFSPIDTTLNELKITVYGYK